MCKFETNLQDNNLINNNYYFSVLSTCYVYTKISRIQIGLVDNMTDRSQNTNISEGIQPDQGHLMSDRHQ